MNLERFAGVGDAPLPCWSRPALEPVDAFRSSDADHRLRRRRSRTDERQTRRKAAVGKPRRSVSGFEPLRRFPERGKEEAVCLPQRFAGCPGRRVEARRRRLLRPVRPGVRVLAQDGRRAEGLTPRTVPLRRGVGIDLVDQPRDQLAILLRAEVTPAGELG